MRLVVDANVLFSFFKKDSFTRRFILSHPELELFIPTYVFEELEKHRKEIKSKANIDDRVFELSKKELSDYVTVIPLKRFKNFWEEAKNISPDPDDTQYFALALFLKTGIWSNEKRLRQQDKVTVFPTHELAALM